MVVIDNKECIGCGLCVNDCFPRNIHLVDGKAEVIKNCMQCGHCVAICPKNLISIDNYDMEDVEAVATENINPDELLLLIKSRRSTRQFTEEKVEEEKLDKIIEVGRYSPTASNMQEISFIVLEDKLQDFRKLVIKSLEEKAKYILAQDDISPTLKFYANLWSNIAKGYNENPSAKDAMFLNAPTLVIMTSNNELNVGLASANMELMANAEGIGVLHSGFIVNACKDNNDIKEMLGIKDGVEVKECLLLGYTDVKYMRTAPRRKANVTKM